MPHPTSPGDTALAAALVAALTVEHQQVDATIEAFIAGLVLGELRPAPLLEAFTALRRHIYLEEELLFPPIRAAGLVMPIQVMLVEHGRIWQVMDRITQLVEGPRGPADDDLSTLCGDLLGLLDQHNRKEEPIVYPRAEVDLGLEEAAELNAFAATGHLPEGWVCHAVDDAAHPPDPGRDAR